MIKVLFGEETYCVWFKKHKYVDDIENKDFNLAEFEEYANNIDLSSINLGSRKDD